jgi:hypothetical protein
MKEISVQCSCQTPASFCYDEEAREIGIDNSFGAYGEVSVHKCIICGRLWLRYFLEMEWYSRSGQWFLGEISEKDAETVKPETALHFLEQADLIIYGGSFFDGIVKAANGSIITNHFRSWPAFVSQPKK